MVSQPLKGPSFSETIAQLENKTAQLQFELSNCRGLMEAEIQLKENAIAELKQTKLALEDLQGCFRKLVATYNLHRTRVHKL